MIAKSGQFKGLAQTLHFECFSWPISRFNAPKWEISREGKAAIQVIPNLETFPRIF